MSGNTASWREGSADSNAGWEREKKEESVYASIDAAGMLRQLGTAAKAARRAIPY